MVAHDICMDVMAAYLAQADGFERLAQKAKGKEKERLLKLESDAQANVKWFFDDAQLAKEGNVRICKKAFLEYSDLLNKLDEENGRGQIHSGQRGQRLAMLQPV